MPMMMASMLCEPLIERWMERLFYSSHRCTAYFRWLVISDWLNMLPLIRLPFCRYLLPVYHCHWSFSLPIGVRLLFFSVGASFSDYPTRYRSLLFDFRSHTIYFAWIDSDPKLWTQMGPTELSIWFPCSSFISTDCAWVFSCSNCIRSMYGCCSLSEFHTAWIYPSKFVISELRVCIADYSLR